MRRTDRLALLSCLAGTMASASVSAQTTTDATARRQIVEQAIAARDAGNHARALDLFLQAGRIQMRPGLRLSIAQEQQAMGRVVEACEAATQCLAEAQADVNGAGSAAALQGCATLVPATCGALGHVRLRWMATPGLQLRVQGREVAATGDGAVVAVVPGAVDVQARAAQGSAFDTQVVVPRGETREVAVRFDAPGVPSLPTSVPAAPVQRTIPSAAVAATASPETGRVSLTSIGPGSGVCPDGMVYIPAARFVMGDAEAASYGAQPPHPVTLAAFCIDSTEVTVSAYRRCGAAGCTEPDTTGYCNWGVGGRDNHPVNCVDWNQARTYCEWRGGNLPTEAQWEYAARGGNSSNHVFPWGNADPAAQCCWSGGGSSPASTCAVRSYPSGNSPFGLSDMAGNVREWVLDWYDDYSPTATLNPRGPQTGTLRVLRGGAWLSSAPADLRTSFRQPSYPSNRESVVGFRCASAAN